MDNRSFVTMFENMLKNMSDKEKESALNSIKGMISDTDYEKLKKLMNN